MKDYISKTQFLLDDIMANFLPLLLKYNQEIYNKVINDLLLDVIEVSKNKTMMFVLNKLVFAKGTEGVTFPPIGTPQLKGYNNLQISWDTPIDLQHEKGCKDELSLVIFNASKNLLEHKTCDCLKKETVIDHTYVKLKKDWTSDELIIWGIWSRYDLRDLTTVIANSDQIHLCVIN